MVAVAGGVPTQADVDTVVRGATFQRMASANSTFLSAHEEALEYYRRIWVSDPLNNWSRRWEYPYIYESLRDHITGSATVLDAGAGTTFFPFFVASQLPQVQITAVDYDPMMAAVYDAAADPLVEFVEGDITKLPFRDAHFDGAYSVSVLEHIAERRHVLAELARVLKPGAPLVFTMDISLDGRDDVPVAEATELLRLAEEYFEAVDVPPLEEALRHPDALLTTRVDPALLPWRWTWRGRLRKAASARRLPWKLTPPIAVYGCVWRRR